MSRADSLPMSHVRSRDGTEIAYWTSGLGSPLVVVHGAAADHTRWRPLLPHLERHFTIHAMDRRGRGASGDAPAYELARECEDVAAVVDAVAEAAGTLVDVYGHSHGGFCAFGAATLTANIRRLALYEGWPVRNPGAFALPAAVAQRMEALLALGDRDAVVETLFRHYGLMSDEEMAVFKAAPSWAGRVGAAHTITRECRAEATARLDSSVAARITIPVLLLVGDESPDPARADVRSVADALPDARIVVLPEQQHVADVLAPELFSDVLIAFFDEQR